MTCPFSLWLSSVLHKMTSDFVFQNNSRTEKKKKKKYIYISLSHVLLFAAPWTVAYQAPLSMGFLRQQYWKGLLFPSPRDLLDPRI